VIYIGTEGPLLPKTVIGTELCARPTYLDTDKSLMRALLYGNFTIVSTRPLLQPFVGLKRLIIQSLGQYLEICDMDRTLLVRTSASVWYRHYAPPHTNGFRRSAI
jgi:hypothetical protein